MEQLKSLLDNVCLAMERLEEAECNAREAWEGLEGVPDWTYDVQDIYSELSELADEIEEVMQELEEAQ